jgi:hypothetical protein
MSGTRPLELRMGFTGTRSGMTRPQRESLYWTLLGVRAVLAGFHHGDCVGSDAQAHDVAMGLGLWVAVHPPSATTYRAYCTGHMEMPPAPYIERDRAIVNATNGLIATPVGFGEERRSGTWATVRYARKMLRPVFIIWPDGTKTIEDPNAA